jgi:hypothetical protein
MLKTSVAKVLWDRNFVLKGKYRVLAKVFEVVRNKRYPEGVKAKFVLIDLEQNAPRLLVDNHAPFGFHMHHGMPADKGLRSPLIVSSFQEAYKEFIKEVERILDEN